MEPVALDTDVASLIIKRKLPAEMALRPGRPDPRHHVRHPRRADQVGRTTPVGPHRRELLDRWLAGKHVLDSNRDVARIWGTITAYAALRGRPRPVNDSWVAACCLAYGVPLATRNVKDYEDFAEHEGLVLLKTS